MNEQVIMAKEQFRNNVIKYIKDNQKRPKKEQTTAYKELELLFKEKGIPIEEMPEIISIYMGG